MGTIQKKLVLGIGNEILTDDGIGPKLVKLLADEYQGKGISFQTAAVGGMELVEILKDFEHVVIIDAIKTGIESAGTIYHLTPRNFKETLHISNFHDISFLTALELAKRMDIPVPGQIDILAIEIVEDLVFSDEFSPDIRQKFGLIYRQVSEKVNELL